MIFSWDHASCVDKSIMVPMTTYYCFNSDQNLLKLLSTHVLMDLNTIHTSSRRSLLHLPMDSV